MPNIPNAMRGFGQQVKAGFLGDNQEFDIADLKPVAKNIAKFGVLGGGIKSLYDAFQSGKPQTTDPTQPWSLQSPINRSTGQTTSPQDFNNLIPNIDSAISAQFQAQNPFAPQIPKGDYGTTVNDVTNTFAPPSDSGLQMDQEQQAQQPAPMPSVAPRVTPQKMPMPNDLDFIFGADQSAYQSRTAPAYANPMNTNGGYFDTNKIGTLGGNWINGAGWYTEADKVAGKSEEDMLFDAQMRQRMASMFS